MITEFFIDTGFKIAEGFLDKLPAMEWTVDTTAWEYLRDFLEMICYLLPLNTIIAIISLIISIAFIRIVISLIRTLLSFISAFT